MGSPIRVGIVDYLNSKPLAWGFLEGGFAQTPLEASFHPPARVADLLRAGELEIALIPSIEVQRIPDLEILPGLCVASEREVRSVLLLSRRPIAQVRRVALDRNSRTSAALVRILFAERYGIAPEFTSLKPDLEQMLAENDAALVIGDPALGVERSGLLVFDLAREWYDLTGLPFVFAVWAMRGGVELGELAGCFERSLERGLAAMPRIVTEASRQLSLPPPVVEEYLTHNLRFRLGSAEVAALEEFYRRCAIHGLIDSVAPIRFAST